MPTLSKTRRCRCCGKKVDHYNVLVCCARCINDCPRPMTLEHGKPFATSCLHQTKCAAEANGHA